MTRDQLTMIPERIITFARPEISMWTIDRIYTEPAAAIVAIEQLREEFHDEGDRAAIEFALGTVCAVLGDLDRADSLLAGVEDYFLARNDALNAAHVRLRRDVVWLQHGEFDFAIAQLEPVLATAREHVDHWLECATLSDMAMLQMRKGDVADGIITMFASTAIADRGDNALIRAVTNLNLAGAMFELHDHRAAASLARETLANLPAGRELPMMFEATSLLAACLEQLGEYGEAIEHLKTARQFADELAYPYGLAESAYDEGRLWIRLNHPEEAREAFHRAIAFHQSVDTPTRDARIAAANWWCERIDQSFTHETLRKLVQAVEANPGDAYNRTFDLHDAIAISADALGETELAIAHLKESRDVAEAYWSALSDRQSQVALRRYQLESARRTAEQERAVRKELATALAASEELNETNLSLLEQLKLQSVELERQAIEDPLTLIGNRRLFVNKLELELARSREFNRPVTVALADIDNFKEVNDRYSHCAGDRVLREVAAILSAHCRKIDTVARYGGEEFGFILPEATMEAAVETLERVRIAIETHNWQAAGEAFPVTVSVGIVRCPPTWSLEAIVAQADAQLYRAKRAGKNQICTTELIAAVR